MKADEIVESKEYKWCKEILYFIKNLIRKI